MSSQTIAASGSDSRSTSNSGVRLRVDNGTHSGTVTRLAPVPGTNLFVTAGSDKRMRTWAGPSPTLVRTMVGDIGPGRDGEIQAMAVQPGTRLLWSAVRRTTDQLGTYRCELRLFDVVTGDILHAMRAPALVNDITFTPDGAHLVTIDQVSLTVYNVDGVGAVAGTEPTVLTSTPMQEDPFRLAASRHGDRMRIFVSSIWRAQPRIFDLSDQSFTEVPFATPNPPHRPDQMAASSSFLAVSNHDGGDLWIYDLDGNPHQTLVGAGGGGPAELAFSNDGRLLIVGSKAGSDSAVTVHDASREFELVATHRADDDMLAVGFLDDVTAITAGGSRFSIATWPALAVSSRPSDAVDPEAPEPAIDGAGQVITAVGIDGHRAAVGFGTDRASDGLVEGLVGGDDDLDIRLDLEALAIGPVEHRLPEQGEPPVDTYRRAVHDDDHFTLRMSSNHNLILDPVGLPMTGHGVFAWDYAECYSLLDDGRVVTGARSGAVRVLRWDDEDRLQGRKLIGHVGPVLDVAVDDRWIITGGRDQIARLWFRPDAVSESTAPDDQADALEPALNLFVAGREWVIWTRSGYYAASAEGERFITFHANRGFGRRAWSFPADRFVDLLYRPELIRAVFRTGSEEAALEELGGLEPIDMSDHLPPVIEPPVMTEVEPYLFRLDFIVVDLASPATRVWILLDGLIEWEMDVTDHPSAAGMSVFGPELWLESGRNEITILAESETAKSIAVDIVVDLDDQGHRTVPADPADLAVVVFDDPGGASPFPEAVPVSDPQVVTASSPPISATAAVPAAVASPEPTYDVVGPSLRGSMEPSNVVPIGAEVTAHLDVEAADQERRLRAEVDGQVNWTALIEAGVALSLRTTMTVPDGEGSVRIVESSGEREQPVFTAEVGAPATTAFGLIAPGPMPPVRTPITVRSGSADGARSKGDDGTSDRDDGDTTALVASPRRPENSDRPTRIPPELFMLSIGVSSLEKKGQSVDDLKYAADDAASVADRFRVGSDGLFDKVHSWLLVDADANRSKIKTARDELVAAVQARSKRKEDERLRARDVVLLFFSGHGVTRRDPDGGRDDFYLVTHDFISEDAPGTAVLFADLIRPFFTLRDFELVVLIDACRSGHAGLDFIERVDPEELAKRLKAPSEQAQHFLCSTSGDQLSYEYRFPYPYNRRRGQMVGHGLFTHAILKRMDEVATVSMAGLAGGVGEALHLWTGTWAEDRRQEPTQYLYGGGRYLRLYTRR